MAFVAIFMFHPFLSNYFFVFIHYSNSLNILCFFVMIIEKNSRMKSYLADNVIGFVSFLLDQKMFDKVIVKVLLW